MISIVHVYAQNALFIPDSVLAVRIVLKEFVSYVSLSHPESCTVVHVHCTCVIIIMRQTVGYVVN